MASFPIGSAQNIRGAVKLLGDKSIAHRAVILSALSNGKTVIENFPPNDDCLFTVKAFQELGIEINLNKDKVEVFGKGLFGFKKPKGFIFLGNSGTSFRILLGLLSGQKFETTLTAAQGLSLRPMMRVIAPLKRMGARLKGTSFPGKADEYPPVTIEECKDGLHGFPENDPEFNPYPIPVASAQVKSAILLAGLYAKKETCITEKNKTRDHTERMLELFGVDIKVNGNQVCIKPKSARELVLPGKIIVPGDVSSAAFFMVLASVCKDSEIILKNIGLNPTRIGIITVLKRMNAGIEIINERLEGKEPVGDIKVKTSQLVGTVITKEEIPSLIDELPVLMVAACFAKGHTRFEDIAELRVKETDRIASMEYNLGKMGVKINSNKESNNYESLWIEGPVELKSSSELKSFGDHRTAMSMIVAGLAAQGPSQIDDTDCINKSFPNFVEIIQSLTNK